ncbi:GNAT family N-acetyltransferase [Nocardia sp. NPDC004568]|uniref:GNAT family N-acetyltransferase n=1 Tax=Nocardia sp. NPDC004568 TaxID=3154551 RepID=UPI0033BBE063
MLAEFIVAERGEPAAARNGRERGSGVAEGPELTQPGRQQKIGTAAGQPMPERLRRRRGEKILNPRRDWWYPARRPIWTGGAEIRVSRQEFALLRALSGRRGQVVSTAEIEMAVWHERLGEVEQVHRLVGRLGTRLGLSSLITPVRGGYRLEAGTVRTPDDIEVGGIVLSLPVRRVTVDGAEIDDISFTCFDVLALLMERPGHVVSLEEFGTLVWGHPVTPRAVRQHVERLRGSLEDPTCIASVYGVGYRFDGRTSDRAAVDEMVLADPELLERGGVRLSPGALRVWVDGSEVEYPARAVALLMLLMRRAGEVVPLDDIADEVWGHQHLPNREEIKQLVILLRKGLGTSARIDASYGRGYRFDVRQSDRSAADTRPDTSQERADQAAETRPDESRGRADHSGPPIGFRSGEPDTPGDPRGRFGGGAASGAQSRITPWTGLKPVAVAPRDSGNHPVERGPDLLAGLDALGELGRLLREQGVVVDSAAVAASLGTWVPSAAKPVGLSVPEDVYQLIREHHPEWVELPRDSDEGRRTVGAGAVERWPHRSESRPILAYGQFRVSVGWPALVPGWSWRKPESGEQQADDPALYADLQGGLPSGERKDLVTHQALKDRAWEDENGNRIAGLPDAYAWTQERDLPADADLAQSVKDYLLSPTRAPLPERILEQEHAEVIEILLEESSRVGKPLTEEALAAPEVRRAVALIAEGVYIARTLYGDPRIGRANHLYGSFELFEQQVGAFCHDGDLAEGLRSIVRNGLLQNGRFEHILHTMVAAAWSDIVYGYGRKRDSPDSHDEKRSGALLEASAALQGFDEPAVAEMVEAVRATTYNEETQTQSFTFHDDLRQQQAAAASGERRGLGQWNTGEDLHELSTPEMVSNAIALAVEDLMSKRYDLRRLVGRRLARLGMRANFVEEALRVIGIYGASRLDSDGPTLREAFVARLRGNAAFVDPDAISGHRYPDGWILGNRDMRRDHAALIRRLIHRLETEPRFSPLDALRAAQEHAKAMDAKYKGFRWQQVIRPGPQPWNPIAVAENLRRRLPGGDRPGRTQDVIDGVLRVLELAAPGATDAFSNPGARADAAIVVTMTQDAAGRPRLRAQLDYTVVGVPVNPTALAQALAGVDCRSSIEDHYPLLLTDRVSTDEHNLLSLTDRVPIDKLLSRPLLAELPRCRVILDFADPVTDDERDRTGLGEQPVQSVHVPITVGTDAEAVSRRARSLVEGALDTREHTELLAPIVGVLITRSAASEIVVDIERREDGITVDMRAESWLLDLEIGPEGTAPVARVRIPGGADAGRTDESGDVHAALSALLPGAPLQFIESMAAETTGLGTGDRTITVIDKSDTYAVEYGVDGVATRIVRSVPAFAEPADDAISTGDGSDPAAGARGVQVSGDGQREDGDPGIPIGHRGDDSVSGQESARPQQISQRAIYDLIYEAGGSDVLESFLIKLDEFRAAPETSMAVVQARSTIVADLWYGLPHDLQDELIDRRPQIIGRLVGIPAAVRDQANRMALDRDFERLVVDDELRAIAESDELWIGPDPSLPEPVRNIVDLVRSLRYAERLAADMHPDIDAPPVHLLGYDISVPGGRAEVGFGDIDTASNVSVHVFGADSTLGTFPERLLWTRNAYEATGRTDAERSTAAVAWLGYGSPRATQRVVTSGAAQQAAPLVTDAMLSLRAGREYLTAHRGGTPAPRIYLCGHRYGGTVISEAAVGGQLDGVIDALVFLGADGAGTAETAAAYGQNVQVFAGIASAQQIGGPGQFADGRLGRDTALEEFGAIRFAAEVSVEGRAREPRSAFNLAVLQAFGYRKSRFAAEAPIEGQYYRFVDEHSRAMSESLANLGRIFAGHGETVERVRHRHRPAPTPWRPVPSVVDPEADRLVRFRDVLADDDSPDPDADTMEPARTALARRGRGFTAGDLMHRDYADDFLRSTELSTDNLRWWAGLGDPDTDAEELSPMQRALVYRYPFEIGNAPGLPDHVADLANRLQLRRDLEVFQSRNPRPGADETNGLSADEQRQLRNLLTTQEALARSTGVRPGIPQPRVYLLAYDSTAFGGQGRTIVAFGSVDNADHVSWQVPGLNGAMQNLPRLLHRVRTLYESMASAKPGARVAAVCWLGYVAPADGVFLKPSVGYMPVDVGSRFLARDMLAYHAARAERARVGGRPAPHITLEGFGNGSTTASYAAAAGRLSAVVSESPDGPVRETVMPAVPRQRPEIQAHRGGGGLWQQNTLRAFDQAIALGVDVIELDVVLTSDGVPVISHEQRIHREHWRDTAPAHPGDPQYPYVGRDIRDLTVAQLRTLEPVDAPRDDETTTAHLPGGMVLLSEVAPLMEGRGVTLAIDIKSTPRWSDTDVRDLVAATVDNLRKYDIAFRFLAFDWRVLTYAKELAPDVERVALFSARTASAKWTGRKPGISPWRRTRIVAATRFGGRRRSPGGNIPELARAAGATMLSPVRTIVTEEFIAQAAAADMPLVPYTINDAAEMRRLIAAGVAGIVTDFPDLLRAVAVESGCAVPASTSHRRGEQSESLDPVPRSGDTAPVTPADAGAPADSEEKSGTTSSTTTPGSALTPQSEKEVARLEPSGDSISDSGGISSPAVVVRLTPKDWEMVSKITRESVADAPESFTPTMKDLRERKKKEWQEKIASRAACLGVMRGDTLIGIVNIKLVSDRSDTVELNGIFVVPRERGTGVGDLLIDSAVDWALEHRFRWIRRFQRADNAHAERLYSRHSFYRAGDEPNYYADGCARICMVRDLSDGGSVEDPRTKTVPNQGDGTRSAGPSSRTDPPSPNAPAPSSVEQPSGGAASQSSTSARPDKPQGPVIGHRPSGQEEPMPAPNAAIVEVTDFPFPARAQVWAWPLTKEAAEIVAKLRRFAEWQARAANSVVVRLRALGRAPTPEDWLAEYRTLMDERAEEPVLHPGSRLNDPVTDEDFHIDVFGDNEPGDGAVWDPRTRQRIGGLPTPASEIYEETGARTRARFQAEGITGEELQNEILLSDSDGTVVDGNRILRGVLAEHAVTDQKRRNLARGLDVSKRPILTPERVVVVPAKKADRERILQDAMEQIARPGAFTVEVWANVAYKLFQAPQRLNGSDSVIRTFLAAVAVYRLGRVPAIPHDIDLRALTLSQREFVRFMVLADAGVVADAGEYAAMADTGSPETDPGTGETAAGSPGSRSGSGGEPTAVGTKALRTGHVDFYHGVEVPDPYSYFEDPDDPRTREYTATQNIVAERYFAEPESRFEETRRRIEQLNGPPRSTEVKTAGGWYFFTANRDSRDYQMLFAQHGRDGSPVMLVDPNDMPGNVEIAGFEPSPDGRHVVYRMRQDGTDDLEIRVCSVSVDGEYVSVDRDYAVAVSRHAGNPSWTSDSSGFCYGAADNLDRTPPDFHVRFHRLGTEGPDKIVHDGSRHKDNKSRRRFIPTMVGDDNHVVVVDASDHYVDFCRLDGNSTPTYRFGHPEYSYEYIGDHAGELFFLTDHDAPNGRIVAVDPKRPDPKNWREVLTAPSDHYLRPAQSAAGARIVGSQILVLAERLGRPVMLRFSLDGARADDVALPADGVIGIKRWSADEREVLVRCSSYLWPPTVMRCAVETGEFTSWEEYVAGPRDPAEAEETGLLNPAEYHIEQVLYPSRDGTMVPITIVHKEGLLRDGSNPTLLSGYGGHGITYFPFYDPSNAALLEQGFVLAFAHVRGGGEFGREWYRAGMMDKTKDRFDDFIAAAEWLIANGYTTRELLAAAGASNGGFMVSGCAARDPGLFRAVICDVGVADLLRKQYSGTGPVWIGDYGNSEKLEDFQFMYALSPVHNIQEGVHHPGYFIVTPDNDVRVPPFHGRKLGATLQHATISGNPVLVYSEPDSGHVGGAQHAIIAADTRRAAFLLRELGGAPGHYAAGPLIGNLSESDEAEPGDDAAPFIGSRDNDPHYGSAGGSNRADTTGDGPNRASRVPDPTLPLDRTPEAEPAPQRLASPQEIYDRIYQRAESGSEPSAPVLTAELSALSGAVDRATASDPHAEMISLLDFGYGMGRVTVDFALNHSSLSGERKPLLILAYDVSGVGLAKSAALLRDRHGFAGWVSVQSEPVSGYVMGELGRRVGGVDIVFRFVHGHENDSVEAVQQLILRANNGKKVTVTSSWGGSVGRTPGIRARARLFEALGSLTDPRGEMVIAVSSAGAMVDEARYWYAKLRKNDVDGYPIEEFGDVVYDTEIPGVVDFCHLFDSDLPQYMKIAQSRQNQRVWVEGIRHAGPEPDTAASEQEDHRKVTELNSAKTDGLWDYDDYVKFHTVVVFRSGTTVLPEGAEVSVDPGIASGGFRRGATEVRRLVPDEWYVNPDYFRYYRRKSALDFSTVDGPIPLLTEQYYRESYERLETFIAFRGDEPIGRTRLEFTQDPGVLEMGGVNVSLGALGTGTGDRMVRAALGWARASGYREVRLWVRENNEQAIDLYRRAGFVFTGNTEKHWSALSLRILEMVVRFEEAASLGPGFDETLESLLAVGERSAWAVWGRELMELAELGYEQADHHLTTILGLSEPVRLAHLTPVVQALNLTEHDTLYHIGSGAGTATMFFGIATAAGEVVGIEPDPADAHFAAGRADRLGLSHVRFVNRDVLDTDLSTATAFYVGKSFASAPDQDSVGVLARRFVELGSRKRIQVAVMGVEHVGLRTFLLESGRFSAEDVLENGASGTIFRSHGHASSMLWPQKDHQSSGGADSQSSASSRPDAAETIATLRRFTEWQARFERMELARTALARLDDPAEVRHLIDAGVAGTLGSRDYDPHDGSADGSDRADTTPREDLREVGPGRRLPVDSGAYSASPVEHDDGPGTGSGEWTASGGHAVDAVPDQVRELLRLTEVGRRVLASLDAMPVHTRFEFMGEGGHRGGEWNEQQHAATVFTSGNDYVAQALFLAHESVHAEFYIENRSVRDPSSLSRREYVRKMVAEETACFRRSAELAAELRSLGFEVPPQVAEAAYVTAYDKAVLRRAGRGPTPDEIHDQAHVSAMRAAEQEVASFRWNDGRDYRRFYRAIWDKASGSKPSSAAQPAQADAGHPGRYELTPAGAERMRQAVLHYQHDVVLGRDLVRRLSERMAAHGLGSGTTSAIRARAAREVATLDAESATASPEQLPDLRRAQHRWRELSDMADELDSAEAAIRGDRLATMRDIVVADIMDRKTETVSNAQRISGNAVLLPGTPARLVIVAGPGEHQAALSDPRVAAAGRGAQVEYCHVTVHPDGEAQVWTLVGPTEPQQPPTLTPLHLVETATRQRIERIRTELGGTEVGAWVLETLHDVEIVHTADPAAAGYKPILHRLVLDIGMSDEQHMAQLVHHAIHVAVARGRETIETVREQLTLPRESYIDIRTAEETRAHAMEIVASLQLRAAGYEVPEPIGMRAYTDAYYRARAELVDNMGLAGRVVPERFLPVLDRISNDAGLASLRPVVEAHAVHGERYRDIYGKAWDAARGVQSFAEQVQAARMSGERSVRTLDDGTAVQGVLKVELIAFNDDSEYVRMPLRDIRDVHAAVLSSRLGRSFGVPMPRIVADGNVLYCEKTSWALPVELGRIGLGSVGLGMHDVLAAFPDTAERVMVGNEKVAWSIHHRAFAARTLSAETVSRFAQRFLRVRNDGTVEGIAHDVTEAELEWFRDRVVELRPEFERLGRADWHDMMMDRLAQIAQHVLPEAVSSQSDHISSGPPDDSDPGRPEPASLQHLGNRRRHMVPESPASWSRPAPQPRGDTDLPAEPPGPEGPPIGSRDNDPVPERSVHEPLRNPVEDSDPLARPDVLGGLDWPRASVGRPDEWDAAGRSPDLSVVHEPGDPAAGGSVREATPLSPNPSQEPSAPVRSSASDVDGTAGEVTVMPRAVVEAGQPQAEIGPASVTADHAAGRGGFGDKRAADEGIRDEGKITGVKWAGRITGASRLRQTHGLPAGWIEWAASDVQVAAAEGSDAQAETDESVEGRPEGPPIGTTPDERGLPTGESEWSTPWSREEGRGLPGSAARSGGPADAGPLIGNRSDESDEGGRTDRGSGSIGMRSDDVDDEGRFGVDDGSGRVGLLPDEPVSAWRVDSAGLIEEFVGDTPPTYEQLRERLRALADRYSDEQALFQEIGRTREDRPMEMLSIYGGPNNIELIVDPHPMEPVGRATVLAFAEYFCSRPELRSVYSLHIVVSADPDRAVSFEPPPRTVGPVDLAEYYLGGEKPPTPDWQYLRRFPVEVADDGSVRVPEKSIPAQQVPWPETLAVMGPTKALEPLVLWSGHNCLDSGAYLFFGYLEDPRVQRLGPLIPDVFAEVAERHGIPIESSPSDVISSPKATKRLGHGVYTAFDLPDRAFSGRFASWYGSVPMTIEVPEWDVQPSSLTRLQAADRLEQRAEVFRSLARRFPPGFDPALDNWIRLVKDWRRDPNSMFDPGIVHRGSLRRMTRFLKRIDEALAAAPDNADLQVLREDAYSNFLEWIQFQHDDQNPVWRPLRSTAGMQLDILFSTIPMVRAADSIVGERRGRVWLNSVTRRAWVEGDEIHLDEDEFALLDVLTLNRRSVVSPADIETAVWGRHAPTSDTAVDALVDRLRDKLGVDGSITSVPGGYQIETAKGMVVGRVGLAPAARKVWVDKVEVQDPITHGQVALLKYFMKQEGDVVSPEKIRERLWQNSVPPETVKSDVSALQRVLGDTGFITWADEGWRFDGRGSHREDGDVPREEPPSGGSQSPLIGERPEDGPGKPDSTPAEREENGGDSRGISRANLAGSDPPETRQVPDTGSVPEQIPGVDSAVVGPPHSQGELRDKVAQPGQAGVEELPVAGASSGAGYELLSGEAGKDEAGDYPIGTRSGDEDGLEGSDAPAETDESVEGRPEGPPIGTTPDERGLPTGESEWSTPWSREQGRGLPGSPARSGGPADAGPLIGNRSDESDEGGRTDRGPGSMDGGPGRDRVGATDGQVEAWNAATLDRFASGPGFAQQVQEIKERLENTAGGFFGNPDRWGEEMFRFVVTADHPRGVWQRTGVEEFRGSAPRWETVLDLDAVSAEDAPLTWMNALISPNGRRALVAVSPDGGDAHYVREYDLETRGFVPADRGGFVTPLAVNTIGWADDDTVFVSTDFGKGCSVNGAGYPLTIKRWRRETPLAAAETLSTGEPTDSDVVAGRCDGTVMTRKWEVGRGSAVGFFKVHRSGDSGRWEFDREDGKGFQRLDVPEDVQPFWNGEHLLLLTGSDWEVGGKVYPAGSLLATGWEAFLPGGTRTLQTVFEPDDDGRTVIQTPHLGQRSGDRQFGWTKDYFVLGVLDDGRPRVLVAAPGADGAWVTRVLDVADEPRQLSFSGFDSGSNRFEITLQSPGVPRTVHMVDLVTVDGHPNLTVDTTTRDTGAGPPAPVTTAGFATAPDGTKVPYFVTGLPGATGPVILCAYGAYGIVISLCYTDFGKQFVELVAEGYRIVTACPRGGGEYGPTWHERGRGLNVRNTIDDFAAVARHLHTIGVCTPATTVSYGYSSGGMLTAAAANTYPWLFGAVIAAAALLDVPGNLRAEGSLFIRQYGDPDDPETLAYQESYSPLQNLPGDAGPARQYLARTHDNRVTPAGNAHKMVARHERYDHSGVYYYECPEGGHNDGSLSTAAEAFEIALTQEFIRQTVGRAPALAEPYSLAAPQMRAQAIFGPFGHRVPGELPPLLLELRARHAAAPDIGNRSKWAQTASGPFGHGVPDEWLPWLLELREKHAATLDI